MRKLILLALLPMLCGCASRTFSTTPRTAIEQLLLSTAVDTALEKFELQEVSGKKVHLDFTNLAGYDTEYIKVAFRGRFAQLGATLIEEPESSDYIAEIASGGVGTEYKSFLIGLPSLPIPGSAMPLPEVSIYRNIEQTGIVKFLVFVRTFDGAFVALDQYFARADRDESFLLWSRSQRKDKIRESWERAELKRTGTSNLQSQ